MVPRGRLHPLATRVLPPYAGKARRCPEPGCITILCGYNPGPHCYRHARDDETDAERSRELDLAARRDARERTRIQAVA